MTEQQWRYGDNRSASATGNRCAPKHYLYKLYIHHVAAPYSTNVSKYLLCTGRSQLMTYTLA